jgi:phage tail protein X
MDKAVDVQPPMPPLHAVSVEAAQEIPYGYPEPAPPPSRVYVTTQGDWWDLISLRCYGMKRGDDHLMHKLIEANYDLKDVSHFPAGIVVTVPPMPVKTEIPLVPWKKALIVT